MKFKRHYIGVNVDGLPNTTETSPIMMQNKTLDLKTLLIPQKLTPES
jgi:hypothetical protein